MTERRRVKKLDPEVVNRIAAGEVVQRPASALKEMLENSLDAKATSIQVTVKDGGMKLLQIQDNGCGISKEDLPIICERYTTSKLESFNDLQSINTYGFRGEALSSISCVAHVTILTKTPEEKCGYKVSYTNGKWKSPPVPCGANQGTQITVENLFYNVPARQKMLKNYSAEFQKILEVMSSYAVHNSSVGFMLKKQGRSDEVPVKTVPNSTAADNIRAIYGNHISRELMEVSGSDELLNLKFSGQITNLNFHSSKLIFLFFINNRLVDSEALRKQLDQLYSVYLPTGTHPFIYLSLQMAPQNVDVNVHPTKHNVFYLYEESINSKVTSAIQNLLVGKRACRTYQLQVNTVLSQSSKPLVVQKPEQKEKGQVYAQEKVRTSSLDQKIDRFLDFSFTRENSSFVSEDAIICPDTDSSVSEKTATTVGTTDVPTTTTTTTSTSVSSGSYCVASSLDMDTSMLVETDIPEERSEVVESGHAESVETKLEDIPDEKLEMETEMDTEKNAEQDLETAKKETEDNHVFFQRPMGNRDKNSEVSSTPLVSERRCFRLTSLEILRQEILRACHTDLKSILGNCSFVGCVNEKYVLLQYGTELYFCNIIALSNDFFYQVMLSEFGNFGLVQLSAPIPLTDLIELSSEYKEDPEDRNYAQRLCEPLIEKAAMLEDYFSLEIENGKLISIPMLLAQYKPSSCHLPDFIYRLATKVIWSDEMPCFRGICTQVAWLYSQPPPTQGSEKALADWKWTVEHVLFPNIKKCILPSKSLQDRLTFCLLTTVKDLYSVFERC